MEIQCRGAGQCLHEAKVLKQIQKMLGAQHQRFDTAAAPLAVQSLPCRHLLRTCSSVGCSAVLRAAFFPLQVHLKTISVLNFVSLTALTKSIYNCFMGSI